MHKVVLNPACQEDKGKTLFFLRQAITMWPRLTLNWWPLCLSLLTAKITGYTVPVPFEWPWKIDSVLKQESCVRIPRLPFASNTTAGELCNLVHWFLPRDREINYAFLSDCCCWPTVLTLRCSGKGGRARGLHMNQHSRIKSRQGHLQVDCLQFCDKCRHCHVAFQIIIPVEFRE